MFEFSNECLLHLSTLYLKLIKQMKRKMERTQDIEWHLKLIACCELGSSNAAVILTGAWLEKSRITPLILFTCFKTSQTNKILTNFYWFSVADIHLHFFHISNLSKIDIESFNFDYIEHHLLKFYSNHTSKLNVQWCYLDKM